MHIFILISLAALLASGCAQKAQKEPARSAIVQEMSGANMIKQGRAVKARIDEINKAARERNAEVE